MLLLYSASKMVFTSTSGNVVINVGNTIGYNSSVSAPTPEGTTVELKKKEISFFPSRTDSEQGRKVIMTFHFAISSTVNVANCCKE
jgi:hypothetical protein